MTALPIAEMDAGIFSAYIPTNLISITDGQIILDARLFYEGHKPAVDIGTSVSRVGGKAQAPALREASNTLRLDYAQFLDLQMFTRFGGVTDVRIKSKIARGQRIRAILLPTPVRLTAARRRSRTCSRIAGRFFSTGCRWRISQNSAPSFQLGSTAQWPPIVAEIERTGRLDDAKSADMKRVSPALVTQLAPHATATEPRPK